MATRRLFPSVSVVSFLFIYLFVLSFACLSLLLFCLFLLFYMYKLARIPVQFRSLTAFCASRPLVVVQKLIVNLRLEHTKS